MSRRVAREIALRALFMIEQGQMERSEALAQARASLPRARQDSDDYAERLLTGTLEFLPSLDAALGLHLQGWQAGQMPAVDRTILRVAAFELLHTDEPVGAVINEAVALAKIYSTSESGRFVNGVLGGLTRASPAGSRPGPSGPAAASPFPSSDR